MFAIIQILLLCAIILLQAYLRVAPLVWATITGLTLVIATIASSIFVWIILFAWIIYAVAIAFTFISPLRQRIISKPLLMWLYKMLPPIGDTERIAMDAGDVWWETELFRGNPNWLQWLSNPKPELSTEEQAFLDNQTTTLCKMLNEWETTALHYDLVPEVWQYLKKEKFWGMVIPKDYGGLGFSALAHSSVIVKIASASSTAAITAMVPNSLGPGELLVRYGTEQQKRKYLPALACGDEIPCFALTGTDAGSDATAMTDVGIVTKGQFNGVETVGIKLTVDKRYITLAPVATLIGLAFKLYDPQHLLSDQVDRGITLALVPAQHSGIEIGNRHLPIGSAFMNGPVRAKDAFIPLDWIIGGAKMIGEGWRMLMECLSAGRGISLPGLATAISMVGVRTTGAYAAIRQQFNLPIGKFPGVAASLARIAGIAYQLEAMRVVTAGGIDQGIKPAVVSAIMKYHSTEMARILINDAMDIHAGKAIQTGPRNYLALAYQAWPIGITVEGANILTRNLIIFGQGAMRCHPYLAKEIDVANNQDAPNALATFDTLLMSHMAFALSNTARSLVHGLTAGKLIASPVEGHVAQYYRQLTRMSSALAFVSDVTMLMLGGELKRLENLSARLGDVLSHLYLASTVLKYFQDNGQQAEDIPFVDWCLHNSLRRIQVSFSKFFANFPYRWCGRLMAYIVFPWGGSYVGVKDSLMRKMADSVMQPTAIRERLTYLSYVNDSSIGLVEMAFAKLFAVEPILKKLRVAIKQGDIMAEQTMLQQIAAAEKINTLTADEAQQLRDYECMRVEVIKVDEFTVEEIARMARHD